MSKGGFVYILCNEHRTTLYTGVTADLQVRISEHRTKQYPTSFSARYNCTLLVYYCYYDSIEAAIEEEKRIKGGSRMQKLKLIEAMNPEWNDLWEEVKLW